MHRSKDQLYSITSSTTEYALGGTPIRRRRNTPVKHLVEAATVPPGSEYASGGGRLAKWVGD
jgi:hypothetical protein